MRLLQTIAALFAITRLALLVGTLRVVGWAA